MFAIPKTMRAVVYRGVNDLRLETVPVPRTGANELLVRVAVCGVCPTDIKKIHYGTVPPPRIFGHETAGTIVKSGARIKKFRVGDRVALHHHVPCLDCHFCRHRAFAQCTTYQRTGITAGFEPAGGGYAEYVRVMDFVLPGVVKIPGKNSFDEGAMLEPVNTVFKAVRRLNVLATDLLESRLKLAKKCGAKRAVLAGQLSTLNPKLDAAIIAVPSDDAVQQALKFVRGAGKILLFAHTRRSSPTRPADALSHPMGEGRGEGGFNFQLDLATICLDEKDLITHRFPLAKTAVAVALATRPTETSLKIVINA